MQACTTEIQEQDYYLVFHSFKCTRPAQLTKLESLIPLYFHETPIAASCEICEDPLTAVGWQSEFKEKGVAQVSLQEETGLHMKGAGISFQNSDLIFSCKGPYFYT